MKNYFEFLTQLIDEGVVAVKKDYENIKQKNNLEGSLFGFESCRGKNPAELLKIYIESEEYLKRVFDYKDTKEYWWVRCYQLEIEYVINVVSAVLVNEGQPPILPHYPTIRGLMRAAAILNIQQ